MTLEDEYFPRGSKAKLDEKTKPRGFIKKKNEKLFKESAIQKKKKRLKRKKINVESLEVERETKRAKKAAEKEKTAQQSIEPLNYKMLVEGMNVLCRVLEVREMDMTVSLPGRIIATVPITNISTPYSKLLNRLAQDEDLEVKSLKELFRVGQIVPCSIKTVSDDSTFKVTASFNPADINKDVPVPALSKGLMLTAAVQSIEDHGYVMDVGLPDVRCFIAKKATEGEGKVEDLVVGQIVQGIITQCQVDGMVATVTLSLQSTLKIKQNVDLNVATLTPGTEVEINVTKVTPQGLMASFGNLIGYIFKDHLANGSELTSYTKQPKPQKAVILYTLPLVNAVYLSLKNSLIDKKKNKGTNSSVKSYPIGRIFEEAVVLESSSIGLFLRLDKVGTKGFIPLRHLSDNQDVSEDTPSQHPPKSKRRCRVLQYASMDEIYICTLKKTLLNQKALRHEDFVVGQEVEGKVDSVTSSGITVTLGHNLKGFVPKLHWADDPRLKRPELRFTVGSTLKCRVLRIQLDRRQLHLTCKPTLVNDLDGPICSESSHLSPKLRIKGTVSLIQTGGVLVSFYGDLTGWIPRVRLQSKGIVDVGRYFFPGQVIDCVVGSVQEESDKITLDLFKPMESQEVPPLAEKTDVKKNATETADVQLGSIVQCRVVKIVLTDDEGSDSAGIEVTLCGTESSKMSGWIPSEHLSDFPQLCPVWLQHYRVGDTIEEAILCSVSKLQVIVSLRASLIDFAKGGRFPSSQAEVQVNATYPCLLTCHRDYGVFASLICPPGRADVMFPKTKIPDHLLSIISGDNFQPLRMVMEGKVLKNDGESKKISLTALAQDVNFHPAGVLESYFQQLDRIRQKYAESSDETLKYLAQLKTGDEVMGKVSRPFDSATKSDLEFDLPNGVKGVVPSFHHAKKTMKVNDIIVGCVLYADVVTRVVYVATRDNIVARLTSKGDSNNRNVKGLGEDNSCMGKILLNSDYFSLLMVSGSVVYSPNVRNWNDLIHPLDVPHTVGTQVKIVMDPEASGLYPIAPYFRYPNHKSHSSKKRQRKTSEASTQSAAQQEPRKKKKMKTATVPVVIDNETAAITRPDAESEVVDDKVLGAEASVQEAVKQPKQVAVKQKAKCVPSSDTKKKDPSKLPRLQLSSSLHWDDDDATLKLSALRPAVAESSDSDDESRGSADEDEGTSSGKLSVKDRREKARQKLERMRQEEKALSAVESTLTDGDRAPVTADDFDRLLLASPNSSILWLQYMAFHLENADVDKARSVAQKALKTMAFREEQEKFNVWIAWLNLEHMYGTTEAYDETFQEALRCNDPLKIHRQMALNFEQNGQSEQAENLYNAMLKKFGKQDRSVWLLSCTFYVKGGKLDTARNVFQKALASLPKKDHIELISRFGQLEVKFGELERGKTMFDTLMMSYPKRTDLWLVYIDTLTKAGHLESARQVLERCVTLQLPAKKMKTMFQKFLDFETAHGDADRVDYVRRKALEYVESKSGSTDE